MIYIAIKSRAEKFEKTKINSFEELEKVFFMSRVYILKTHAHKQMSLVTLFTRERKRARDIRAFNI